MSQAGKLRNTILLKDNIFRFDVSMEDPIDMEVLKTLEDTGHEEF